jgi:pilus assembly protein Flp/PilA
MKDKLWMLSIKLKNVLAQEEGQDLIEYALIAAIIALGAVTSMGTLATTINTAFGNIGTGLSNAAG